MPMNLGKMRQQKGITIFEIVMVVIMVSILIVYALDALLQYRVKAEEVRLAQNVTKMQSALFLFSSNNLLKNDKRITQDCFNPMDFLSTPPSNYKGEIRSDLSTQIEEGSWYFAKDSCMLIYRVVYDDYFNSDLRKGAPRARFKVSKDFGVQGSSKSSAVILKMTPVEAYSWKVD